MSGIERTLVSATHMGVLTDRGIVLTYSDGTPDAYGKPQPSYRMGSEIPCAYIPLRAQEIRPYGTETALVEGTLLVPLDTSITNRDRVQMTVRLGDALPSPLVFTIIGMPVPGLVAIVCMVRSVAP